MAYMKKISKLRCETDKLDTQGVAELSLDKATCTLKMNKDSDHLNERNLQLRIRIEEMEQEEKKIIGELYADIKIVNDENDRLSVHIKQLTWEKEVNLSKVTDTPDIVRISEHWFADDGIVLACIPGYRLVSNFSRSSPYGGTCIYISTKLSFEDLNEVKEMDIEKHVKICAAIVRELKYIIFSVYRPPSGNEETFFSIFNAALNMNTHFRNYRVMVCGDFNMDLDRPSSRTKRF
ncbi:hypothetical protein HHI36_018301 [Cryptolaemus montrouzieri]|uniref:Endonuclease/exonuclease/phosphatase domain-containing protein n=1 Tax=Cryptolaemus montrouzieri TaxID=559131 RepID=A0ABD2NZR6_9CUCU